jgi:GNAT superfamily N-acetyltransferase
MFDMPPSEKSRKEWHLDLPLDERGWNIGLIVGPSGCGKSSIARRLWPELMEAKYTWNPANSLLDDFPAELGIKEILELLSSVGFNSPPAWLRPFHVLSTGEQFRVTLARSLAESREFVVLDEFTSVVDRTVAQIGSAALAKTVRRRKQQFVAVTCHEDVLDWLQPDWVVRPDLQLFQWRSLQRRPAIELEIIRAPKSLWKLFAPHHYLNPRLHAAAVCFAALYKNQPIGFTAWVTEILPWKPKRCSRIVVLPDYQGAGIALALLEHDAKFWTERGTRATITTAHPGMIASLRRKPAWKMKRAPSLIKPDGRRGISNRSHAINRLTASFEYIGPKLEQHQAAAAGNRFSEGAGVAQDPMPRPNLGPSAV